MPQDYSADKYKTTHMNGARYNYLVSSKFAEWRERCFPDGKVVHLVQDHERCLWQQQNLDALQKAKCPVVEQFPKSSPDLNAIEGIWKLLRDRLHSTDPAEFESRAQFLVRLRRAVNWLNDTQSEMMLTLCTNQKVRAKAVKELKGARCKW